MRRSVVAEVGALCCVLGIGLSDAGGARAADAPLVVVGHAQIAPVPPGSGRFNRLQLACPSPTQCTAVAANSSAFTFDPTDPGTPAPSQIDPGGYVVDVACPSVTQCTAVDNARRTEITFDPQTPASPTASPLYPPDSGAEPLSVACPSVTQCTAVTNDSEVTFNPQAPVPALPVVLNPDYADAAWDQTISCPSVTQCTALDGHGDSTTFNPQAPAPIRALTGVRSSNVICPSTTICLLTGGYQESGTFNPLLAPSQKLQTIAEQNYNASFFAAACPLTTLCVSVGGLGEQTQSLTAVGQQPFPQDVLVDPYTLPLARYPVDLSSVACPTASQCTTIDDDGGIATFDPTAIPVLRAAATWRGQALTVTAASPIATVPSVTVRYKWVLDNSYGPITSEMMALSSGKATLRFRVPTKVVRLRRRGAGLVIWVTAPGLASALAYAN